jgi:hypothetical protein
MAVEEVQHSFHHHPVLSHPEVTNDFLKLKTVVALICPEPRSYLTSSAARAQPELLLMDFINRPQEKTSVECSAKLQTT